MQDTDRRTRGKEAARARRNHTKERSRLAATAERWEEYFTLCLEAVLGDGPVDRAQAVTRAAALADIALHEYESRYVDGPAGEE